MKNKTKLSEKIANFNKQLEEKLKNLTGRLLR